MKIIQIIVFSSLLLLFGETRAADHGADTVTFAVSGNCEMCKETIEEALDVKGVKSADWNMETGRVTIIHNPHVIDVDTLHKLIAAVGYDTEKVKADDKAYAELPGCCQYSRKKK